MAVISIVIVISRPSVQMACRLEVPTQEWLFSHMITLWPLLSSVPFFLHKDYSNKICMPILCPHNMSLDDRDRPCQWVHTVWHRWRSYDDSFELLTLAGPTFDPSNQSKLVVCCNIKTHLRRFCAADGKFWSAQRLGQYRLPWVLYGLCSN